MAIQTYAVVNISGLVTNLVAWDGEAHYDVSPSTLVLTNGDAKAQTGGTYSAGVFTPPQAVATPPQEAVPNARTLSLATAYQALDPSHDAEITINLTSSASLTLTAGTANTADVVLGATTAVANGTGSVVGKYANTLTGALVVGANLAVAGAEEIRIRVPAGWYFAVRQTAGSVTIASAFDQSIF